MPRFETLTLEKALMSTSRGKRAEITREYVGYINQLQAGQAGRLVPGVGESVAAVRRRLGAAAKMVGKGLVIKRQGDAVFFWFQAPGKTGTGRRRGRPRKSAAPQ